MTRIAPWVPSLDSIIQTAPRPHTFTFCTVSREGLPRARTCVLRSWLFDDKTTGALVFTTDRRSAKMDDLQSTGNKFEACFYFGGEYKTQFRIGGVAQVLTKDLYPSLDPLAGSTSTTTSTSTPPSPPLAGSPFSKQHPQPHQVPALFPSTPPQSTHHWPLSNKPKHSTPYPIFSPAFKLANDIYTSPAATRPQSFPPTSAEWLAEHKRLWSQMRPAMKSSFKRPQPGSPLTTQAAKTLDSIARGVDGQSHDETALDNFVVVVMLCDQVDVLVDQQGGKRYMYERIAGDEWVEVEVCP